MVRGVSGGERKRTAIACELVTDPRVIFCDEPTSGLDSETAIAIMGLLTDIAHAGRTVVCTVRQFARRSVALCSPWRADSPALV